MTIIQKGELMGDLISRQAAIDAIKNTYGLSYIEDGFNRQDAVSILEDLPSAQLDPLNDIDRMKYFVCCPMCDLPKCVKGEPECEAERWAEARRKEGEQDERSDQQADGHRLCG